MVDDKLVNKFDEDYEDEDMEDEVMIFSIFF